MAFLSTRLERGLVAAAAAALLAPLLSRAADIAAVGEYRVKAAFLLNFLKFTQWPDAAPGESLVIGVLLPDPFGPELDEAARAMKVADRRVEVRRFRRLADARGTHLLFVPRDAEYAPADLPRPGRLTVGETPRFLSDGGIISFYMSEGKVRFEIDPSAAQRAGVRIHANVLQLGVRR